MSCQRPIRVEMTSSPWGTRRCSGPSGTLRGFELLFGAGGKLRSDRRPAHLRGRRHRDGRLRAVRRHSYRGTSSAHVATQSGEARRLDTISNDVTQTIKHLDGASTTQKVSAGPALSRHPGGEPDLLVRRRGADIPGRRRSVEVHLSAPRRPHPHATVQSVETLASARSAADRPHLHLQ